MSLIFIEKVKDNREAFTAKVIAISSRVNINPNWLMALINSESAGTFSPSILNGAGSGAVGLIQFMPATARSLGTSTEALARMSNVEQLDWVEKYIKYTMGYLRVKQLADYDDLYFLIFYPAAIGKPDNWAFPQTIYRQNAGVDMDKDGVITVADFKEFIRRKIPTLLQLEFLGQSTKKKPSLDSL
jgi:soluble lytic murein transglycosylase-like protein